MSLKKLNKPILAYKAFNKDMSCLQNNYKYEEGKSYHEDYVTLCCSGFHACIDPLDLFSYYYSSESIYHKVELSGKIDRSDTDSKVAVSDIKILEEISLTDILELRKNEIKKNIKVYSKIEDKRLGIVYDKDSLEEILSKNEINLGNRITIIDGEYNYEWICVHKFNPHRFMKKYYQYYFMMDTPIYSLLDYYDNVVSFKDTWFNKEILGKLELSLEEKLKDNLKEMEIKDDYHRSYKTKITLPSIEEVCSDDPLFTYFKICNNYNIDKFTKFSRTYFWLRSKNYNHYGGKFYLSHDNGTFEKAYASINYNTRPLILIG